MEFLSFDAAKKTLTLKKAPVPKPGPGEILIKVAYSGVCGTDLHILEVIFFFLRLLIKYYNDKFLIINITVYNIIKYFSLNSCVNIIV